MKLSEIQDLIKFVAKSGVSEVGLETKDVKITIKAPGSRRNLKEVVVTTQPTTQPAVQATPQNAPVAAAPAVEATPNQPANTTVENDESKYVVIKSPMIGTFYRSSSPDKPPFVKIDDTIAPGKIICIIEAMKLFNEVESEIKGKIVKVLVNDVTPVEYDQPLFLVDPS